MEDGSYGITHKGPMMINSVNLPVDRVPRTDGVLQLHVRGRTYAFDVLIPLDEDSPSWILRTDSDGQPIQERIFPSLWYFSRKPFPVPRERGNPSVPEAISYDSPTDPEIQCSIAIYNDERLLNAPQANGDPSI